MLKHKRALINQPSPHTLYKPIVHFGQWALPDICHARFWPVQAALEHKVVF